MPAPSQPAAYAFARFEFPGRRVFLIGLFATNAFPRMGLFATLASLYYALGLMNTVAGIVIVQLLGTIVFMTWIPAAAFSAVPRSLEEAARDAGASRARVFFGVTLRMALPGILVGAVATDTWGFEVRPNEFDGAFQPLHQVVIPNMGLFIGEMWDLDVLAADCAADGRYDVLLTAAPIPVTGAVGAPVNPIALK